MSMKRIIMGMILLAMVAGMTSVTLAADAPEDYAQAPAKHFHEVDNEFMQKFHNPMDGLTMGLDLRLREVYGRNIFSVDDNFGDAAGGNWNNYHWQRYRARLSTKWNLSEDVDFNTRLAWEFWGHGAPEESFSSFLANQNDDFDEMIFDHFNIKIRNAFDLPLTLTIGRQDIILGTGWLVLDGTPADGSRTIFFDAIRGTYELTDATKLDMIFIKQYDAETKWLKPFNHREGRRHVTNKQDETGLIFYLTNKCGSQQRELYYMYKKDEPSDWSKTNTPTSIGSDGEVHTIGGRLAGPIDDNWSYSVEAAKQWGKVEDSMGADQTMSAFGTNNRLTYAFNDEKQSQVFAMYEFLSGDDPTTSTNEKFETLWGDWPHYERGGDLQSYLWTFEGNLGEVSNLHRAGVGHSFKPAEVWTMQTMYNLMWADEQSMEGGAGAAGSPIFSSGGEFRGQMFTGLLTYQCCKAFKTEFLVDYFVPGSYYDGSTQDHALFARVNVEWTF